MKKNGFIATSLMFSFFIIFLTMSLMIMATYTQYNGLITNLNSKVLDDLNTNVIADKYIVLTNVIDDGDIESMKTGTLNSKWTDKTRVDGVNDYANFNTYIRMKPGKNSSSFKQYFTGEVKGGKRKLLVRFDIYRNSTINCDSNNGTVTVAGTKLGYSLCGDSVLWTPYYFLIDANISGAVDITFSISNISSAKDWISVNSLYVGIKNIMVVDVTDAYLNAGTSDADLELYFIEKVPYFNGDYTIKKI